MLLHLFYLASFFFFLIAIDSFNHVSDFFKWKDPYRWLPNFQFRPTPKLLNSNSSLSDEHYHLTCPVALPTQRFPNSTCHSFSPHCPHPFLVLCSLCLIKTSPALMTWTSLLRSLTLLTVAKKTFKFCPRKLAIFYLHWKGTPRGLFPLWFPCRNDEHGL